MSKLWSSNRPTKPAVDPLLDPLRNAARGDNRSYYAKANVSGLSPSTIRNLMNGKTKRPQAITLQMMWGMLGYELKAVPKKKDAFK